MSKTLNLYEFIEYLEIEELLSLENPERAIALTLHKDGWTGSISELVYAAQQLARDEVSKDGKIQ
jgi:hypothetical protein